jgi:hypothetical protein
MPESSPIILKEHAREKHQSRTRVRYNRSMKLIRRAHMYAGLFLLPWVFLYGVTAFLFNHPEAFPDREVRTVSRSEAAGTPLGEMPGADELATRVVKAVNDRSGGRYRLSASSRATLSRPLTVTASGHGREHSVRYDFDTGEAIIRSTPAAGKPPTDLPDGEVLHLDDSPRERLARGVPALLGKLGIDGDSITIRNPPDLIFEIEGEGHRWRTAYNLQTERISVRPADDPASQLSSRRFLTGLHLAFGYPSSPGVRWAWAVIVDVMAAAMVVWGCSGLMMWWQMKSLRRFGLVVMMISLTGSVILAIGMHGLLGK